MIPYYDTAFANFAIGGVICLLAGVAYFANWQHRRNLDNAEKLHREQQAQSEKEMVEHLKAVQSNFAPLIAAVKARGLAEDQCVDVIHSCKMGDTERATSVEVMKSVFYDIGFDRFGQGSSVERLMFYHKTNVHSLGFVRRVLEIEHLLEDHGWQYESCELPDLTTERFN